jgi:hypothetical protein
MVCRFFLEALLIYEDVYYVVRFFLFLRRFWNMWRKDFELTFMLNSQSIKFFLYHSKNLLQAVTNMTFSSAYDI